MTTENKACNLSIGTSMNAAMSDTRLRILVVGAGIGGATFAALMHQRGERVVVVEQGSMTDDGGYVLGLYPLGGRVLNSLDMQQRYHEISAAMERYCFHGQNGKVLTDFSLRDFAQHYGYFRSIDRGLLLSLIRSNIPKECIYYNTRIQHIQNNDYSAVVTFSDGSAQEFDIVVGADGIHSEVRSMVLMPQEVQNYSTGWGGWGLWGDLKGIDGATYREMWGRGWGVGMYPVKNKLAIFLGGNKKILSKYTAREFVEHVQEVVPKGSLYTALQTLDGIDSPFFWNLEDCRAKQWYKKRVILLGDAAAAFLPTAGIGASMAMDSAAALADELSRGDVEHLHYAFSLYVRRQKRRVELAQQNSRMLARFMFCNSAITSILRDQVLRHYSLKSLLKNIERVMEGR